LRVALTFAFIQVGSSVGAISIYEKASFTLSSFPLIKAEALTTSRALKESIDTGGGSFTIIIGIAAES